MFNFFRGNRVISPLFCLFFAFACLLQNESFATSAQKPTVLVSIAPYKTFVKEIAANTVDVAVVVPPGASSHTFEPTPRQMMQLSNGTIWFRINEGFEPRLAKVMNSYSPDMKMVNLREGVDMIRIDPNAHATCCQHDLEDIHIWLSPREAKGQAKTIANALIKEFPQNKELYQKNLQSLTAQLEDLDRKIQQTMKENKGSLVLVSHPAYAYFARDYGLQQLSIEFEGKDPTPQQLTHILSESRKNNIKKVFTQPQHSNKGAELVARHLGAQIVSLDPYSEDYFNNMLYIAQQFSSSSGAVQQ